MTTGVHTNSSKSAVDSVLRNIYAMITEDGLSEGDSLPTETEIARRFSTSRNTVREAISVLKAYGVVESRRRGGSVLVDNRNAAASNLFAFSQHVSPDSFNDIQGFRRLVELGIADSVLDLRSDNDLDALIRLNDEMQATTDVVDAARLDYLFHLQLVTISGNTTTLEVYRFLEPVIRRLLEIGKSQAEGRTDIGAEHHDIIEAIRNRDQYAYLHRMDHHLKSGLKFIS